MLAEHCLFRAFGSRKLLLYGHRVIKTFEIKILYLWNCWVQTSNSSLGPLKSEFESRMLRFMYNGFRHIKAEF